MRLKIGELAKRCGLSVRTLHHYDQMGLLRPSERTTGGARLYGPQDLCRLHRIQVLKQLGYSLLEIGYALDNASIDPMAFIDQQARRLDDQARRAKALSTTLKHLSRRLAEGAEADTQDWLSLLEMMTLYEQHLTDQELRAMRAPERGSAQAIEAERRRLVEEVRDGMRRGLAADSPHARRLAWRWVDMVIALTGNQAAIAVKLRSLQERNGRAQEIVGIEPSLLQWIDQAIVHARVHLFSKYMSQHQASKLRQLQLAHRDSWPELVAQVQSHMAAAVRRLLLRWRHGAGCLRAARLRVGTSTFARRRRRRGTSALCAGGLRCHLTACHMRAVRAVVLTTATMSVAMSTRELLAAPAFKLKGCPVTNLNTSASPAAVPPQVARYLNGPLSGDRQFDFLIGDWSVMATKYGPDGATHMHYEALWSARSLNEGRMIVDDFKALAPDGRAVSSFVTLRTYCAESRRWEMVGLAALQAAGRMEWHGVWVDGEMRIDAVGVDPSGHEVRTRIGFSDVSAERFVWTSESSVSGGPWQRIASLVATRSERR